MTKIDIINTFQKVADELKPNYPVTISFAGSNASFTLHGTEKDADRNEAKIKKEYVSKFKEYFKEFQKRVDSLLKEKVKTKKVSDDFKYDKRNLENQFYTTYSIVYEIDFGKDNLKEAFKNHLKKVIREEISRK